MISRRRPPTRVSLVLDTTESVLGAAPQVGKNDVLQSAQAPIARAGKRTTTGERTYQQRRAPDATGPNSRGAAGCSLVRTSGVFERKSLMKTLMGAPSSAYAAILRPRRSKARVWMGVGLDRMVVGLASPKRTVLRVRLARS